MPAARPGDPRITSGETITVALDWMTAMQLRELTWGDPFHLAAPEDLARAAGRLLRQAVLARITTPQEKAQR